MPASVTINGRTTTYAKPSGQVGGSRPRGGAGASTQSAALFGAFPKRISREKLNELAEYIKNEWLKLVSAEVPSEKRDEYLAGMQPMVKREGGFELLLTGRDAVKLEMGWRPPDGEGKSFEDGFGLWDGAKHDMRSFLLSEGKVGTVKQGRNAGKKYRVIAYWEAKDVKDLVDDAVEGADDDAAKAFAKGLKNQKVGATLGEKYTAKLKTKSVQMEDFDINTGEYQDSVRSHLNPKYHHVVKNYGGKQKAGGRAKFTVFRTVVDSDLQKQRNLWFTTGTKPVRLLRKLQRTLRKAIVNIANNKRPDGSSR